MAEDTSVPLYLRLPKPLHDRLVDEQAETKRVSGYEPTLSEVARSLMEEGLKTIGTNGRKGRRK